MWLVEQLAPGSGSNHCTLLMWLRGELDHVALREAIDLLHRRQAVLRTVLAEQHGRLVQRVQRALPVDLPSSDLSDLPDPAAAARGIAAALGAAPYALDREPPVRWRLLRTAPNEHLLVLCLHHIAVDGWSESVLWQQLAELYSARRLGRTPPPQRLRVTYTEYAARQRRELAGGMYSKGLGYWRRHLAGAPAVVLPGVGGESSAYAGAADHAARTFTAGVPAELSLRLQQLARDERASSFMVLLAGFCALLRSTTQAEDLVIGTPTAGRSEADVHDLVGYLVNPLAMRFDLSGRPTPRELLRRVRATCLDGMDHQDVPFEEVVKSVARGRSSRRRQLTPVMFQLHNVPEPEARWVGLEAAREQIFGTACDLDLSLSLEPRPNGLVAHWTYHTALFHADEVKALHRRYLALLAQIADAPDIPLPAEAAHGGQRREKERWTAPPRSRRPETAAGWAEQGTRLRTVVSVFDEVLGSRPGLDEDFLAAGGHSLTAVQAAERLRRRLALPVTGLEVMECGSARRLGRLLDERAGAQLLARAAGEVPTSARAHRARTPSAGLSGAAAGPVLVTGATGGVGSFVVRELLARGRSVRALVRPESAHLLAGEPVEIVAGDLADADSLRAAADGVGAVVHAACTFTSPNVDVAAMRALLAGGSAASFVFVSSVDAYGSPPPGPVAEGAGPVGAVNAYGEAKLACERLLAQARRGTPHGWSAVRVPAVWGCHDRLHHQLRWGVTGSLLQAAQARTEMLLPGTRETKSRYRPGLLPWISAHRLARFLVDVVESPAYRVVNAIGGHVDWLSLALELRELVGSDSRLAYSPDAPAHLFRAARYASALREPAGGAEESWRAALAEAVPAALALSRR